MRATFVACLRILGTDVAQGREPLIMFLTPDVLDDTTPKPAWRPECEIPMKRRRVFELTGAREMFDWSKMDMISKEKVQGG